MHVLFVFLVKNARAITTINDGKTHLHLDADAELDKDELMSILKSIGLN